MPTTPTSQIDALRWLLARDAKAVTPSDSADLPDGPATLYITVAGNVSVHMADDDAAAPTAHVFALAVGFSPLVVKRVLSTDTTATTIIAMYPKKA